MWIHPLKKKVYHFKIYSINNIIVSVSKSKNEVSPSKVLENSDLKKEFERDLNDKSKVWCKTCKKPFKSVIWDLKVHLKEGKLHQPPEETKEGQETAERQNNKKNERYQACIDQYLKGQSIARAEIIWSFLTIFRNLSFNLSEYAGDYLPHMFVDSKIAEKIVIYRQKTKKIVEDVLLKKINFDLIQKMRQSFSLSLDCSRDCSNKNQFVLAVHYFDEKDLKFMHVVYEIFEQNQTKGEDLYKTINDQFKIDRIPWKSLISVTSDMGSDLVGKENGAIAHMIANNKSIFHQTCICHKLDNAIKYVFRWIDKLHEK